MKDRLEKFFRGIYGGDQLTRFLVYLAMIFLIIGTVFKNGFIDRKIFSYISLLLILYANFRVFSKNIEKRSMENQKFLRVTFPLRNFLSRAFRLIFGKNGYKYFICKNCKTELRIPKKKGKIKVICPKCKTEYIKRT